MRVLILHNAYATRGGEDAVVAAESELLAANGHEVRLCIRDSRDLHASKLRGALETLATPWNPDAAHALERALEEFQPELVHVHNLFPRWGLSTLGLLARRKLAVVQTLHNFRWLCAPATQLRDGHECTRCARGDFRSAVTFNCMPQGRAVSAAYALALAANRAQGLAERLVQRFVCVSEFVREAHLAAGFPAQKLVVKGHFVASAPGADGPGDGSVIYAGRLSEEKGVAVLLRALALLPGVGLKIAGEGDQRSALEAGLSPALRARVHFLGRLTREALDQELARSSVCVVPSLANESFGLAALEAFARGRPVVASRAGGLPELVRDGENGWLVPRGDVAALAERVGWLLAHPAEAQAFGGAGRRLVERHYLPAPNRCRLEEIYAQAVALARDRS